MIIEKKKVIIEKMKVYHFDFTVGVTGTIFTGEIVNVNGIGEMLVVSWINNEEIIQSTVYEDLKVVKEYIESDRWIIKQIHS